MFRYGWLAGSVVVALGGAGAAIAQPIAPDNSLGTESSQVTTGFQGTEIRGGAPRGGNLFHSFQTFGIGAGQSGFFVINDPGIETVLARVTGNQRSDILGQLGVRLDGSAQLPAADLFLINPNGVFFGPDASLSLGGSFAATTATAAQFGDQGRFSTVQPATVPLLTVQPTALAFGQAVPAGIRVESGAIDLLGAPSGLVVENGQQIMLVAGDIALDNGVLIAQNGRIDLAALSAPGTVELTAAQGFFQPQLSAAQPRADVSVVERSGLNVSADRGGDISIQADDVRVGDGSLILSGVDQPSFGNGIAGLFGTLLPGGGSLADLISGALTGFLGAAGTDDSARSGDVVIDATGLVQFSGASVVANGTLFARDGGGIRISASAIEVLGGSNIGAVGNGSGSTQDIVLEADESILVSGVGGAGQFDQVLDSIFSNFPLLGGLGSLLPLDEIFAQVAQTNPALGQLIPGIGGDRPSAVVNYVAPVSALGSTAGDSPVAGNVILKAPSIMLRDGSLGVPNLGDGGDTGDIEIRTDRLEMTEGARILANANGISDGGNILIAPHGAGLLTVQPQVRLDGQKVAIQTTLNPGATGQGGKIEITNPEIQLLNGANLVSTSLGNGDGGDIQLTARDRVLISQSALLADSGRENNPDAAVGDGGDIAISTAVFDLQNGLVRSAVFGQGDAGNIRIEAGDRFTNDSGEVSTRVSTTAVGAGGDIAISAGDLEMRNDARLTTNTFGRGDAGSIDITATGSVTFQGVGTTGESSFAFSRVNPGAVGNGGNISLQASQLSLRDGAQVASATEGDGNAGAIAININGPAVLEGTNSVTGRSSGIFTNNGTPGASGSAIGTGFSGNIDFTAAGLTLSDSAVLNARTSNDQPGGNITLDLIDLAILGGAQIISTSDGSGPAGTVQFNATNGALIAGQDPNYAARLAQFGANVGPLSANSGIRLRSTGTGEAGNLTVGNPLTNSLAAGQARITPRLRLENAAEIIADSNAANGGDITLNIPEVIFLEGGSFIGASAGRAQGNGNGGNIFINSDSVLASPNGNNDIIANAFSGTGGVISVQSSAISGFITRPNEPDVARLRSNRTNDITVNADPTTVTGQSGQLDLPNLNVDPSQGAAELPVDLTDPSNQISNACRPSTIARSEFVVTGRSGLPLNPGEPMDLDPAQSSWLPLPAAIANGTTTAQPPVTNSAFDPSEPLLLEASAWHRGPAGKVQLLAQKSAVKTTPYQCEAVAVSDR